MNALDRAQHLMIEECKWKRVKADCPMTGAVSRTGSSWISPKDIAEVYWWFTGDG